MINYFFQTGSNGIYKNLSYHNYEALTNALQSLQEKYSDYLTLYSLSEKSVEGRELWVMKITTDKGQRADLKPMVKYVANMHGNEPTGREVTLAFIDYLMEKYVAGSVSIISTFAHRSKYLLFCRNQKLPN